MIWVVTNIVSKLESVCNITKLWKGTQSSRIVSYGTSCLWESMGQGASRGAQWIESCSASVKARIWGGNQVSERSKIKVEWELTPYNSLSGQASEKDRYLDLKRMEQTNIDFTTWEVIGVSTEPVHTFCPCLWWYLLLFPIDMFLSCKRLWDPGGQRCGINYHMVSHTMATFE
jgi:hypothetical protein